MDLGVGDRNPPSLRSHKTQRAVGTKYACPFVISRRDSCEYVTAEQGQLDRLPPIAPTMHGFDQRQEVGYCLFAKLLCDYLLVSGARLQRKPLLHVCVVGNCRYGYVLPKSR